MATWRNSADNLVLHLQDVPFGSGATFQEAIEAADAAGDPEAIFEVAPAPYLT